MKIKSKRWLSFHQIIIHYFMVFSIVLGQLATPMVALSDTIEEQTNPSVTMVERSQDDLVAIEAPQINEESNAIVSSENNQPSSVNIDEGKLKIDATEKQMTPTPISPNNSGIVLGQFDLYDTTKGNENIDLYSGKQTTTYVSFSTTATQGTQNYTVKLKFNKNFIDKDDIITSNPTSLSAPAIIEEDNEGNYIVTYQFNDLTGGTDLSFPTKFIAKSGPTPNGYQLPVTATIYADDLSNPIDTKTINYTYKVKNIVTEKQIKKDDLTYSNLDQEIISAGEESDTHSGFLSEDVTKLKPVTFRYHSGIGLDADSNLGNRNLEKVIYRDTLPTGAVFLPKKNPGWTYDETSRVATYEYTVPEDIKFGSSAFNSPVINLLFPDGELYDINDSNKGVYTNKIQAEYIPKDKADYENTIVYEDSVDFRLAPSEDGFSAEKTGWERIYNTEKYLENWEGPWYFSIANPLDEDIENFQISDDKLDEHLYFSKVYFPQMSSDIFEGTVDIYSEIEGGQKTLVAENVDFSTSEQTIELTGQVIKVYVEAHNTSSHKSVLKPTTSDAKKFKMTLFSKIKDPTVQLSSGYVFKNEATLKGNKDGKDTFEKIVIAQDKVLIDPNQTFHIRKNVKTENRTFGAGEKIPVTLDLNSNGVLPNTEIKFTQVVDLLPIGVNYVPNSSTLNIDYGKNTYQFDPSLANGTYEPKVVPNYKGTGRTALVWEILPVIALELETASDSFPYQINYQMEVTKYASIGENINNVFVGWENNDEIIPIRASNTSTVETDIYDLNNNGRTDDLISGAQGNFTHSPVKELISRKTVKGSLDTGYTLDTGDTSNPGVATSEIASDGSYELSILNNSDNDYQTFVLLDILPYVGDKTVGINKLTGERIARNSQFEIHLSGPITVPEGYKVYYSQDLPTGNDMGTYVNGANWEETPTNFSQVRAFKIELQPGFVLNVGKNVNFGVPFVTPNNDMLGRYGRDDAVNEQLLAVNSFGVATAADLNFTESNNASIELFKYKVEGYVFEDLDEKDALKGDNDKPFKNYVVKLIDNNGNPVKDLDNQPIQTTTDDNGYYTMDVFRHGDYKVQIITPDGYTLVTPKNENLGSHITDENNGTTDSFNLSLNNPIAKKNAGYSKNTISISGQKIWDDANNQDNLRPKEITVKLVADGVDTGKTQTTDATKDWKYSFDGLAPTNAQGQNIVYTVEEADVINGYTAKVTGYDITNTHTPSTVNISGKKIWDDANNQDGKRPTEVVVNLLADGQPTGQKATVTEATNWAYEFTDLPEFKDGQKIVYTVTEDAVAEYTTNINGFDITNSYQPGKTSIRVTKAWIDNNNQDGLRPDSIKVQLYADGQKVGAAVDVTAADNWSYTWSDLPEKAAGKIINYSVVEEDTVAGYTSATSPLISGNVTITNSHIPTVTQVSGKKIWNDANNQDGKRPTEVVVNLLADGQPTGQKVTVNEASNWEYQFTNLPEYKAGQKIIYTVSEDPVAEYTTDINGFDITNSYTPGKTNITVFKIWDDGNNQDNLRPDSVKVQLYANGQKLGEAVELTDKSIIGWTYTWSDLDIKANGQDIVYTVEEVGTIDGYTTTVGQLISGSVTIINKHTPSTISVKGQKTWDDANNQDGIRPDSVTVHLFADGVDTGKTAVASAETNWTYEFTDLPEYKKKENGNSQFWRSATTTRAAKNPKVVYTVVEDAVPGYTTDINGFDITNTHTPSTIKVSGTKTWNDANNQDGVRPAEIIVNLLADGVATGQTKTVTAADNWTYDFTDLPEFKDGQKIVYSVTENKVDNYTVAIDGYNITNSYKPGKTSVTVVKAWDDANNQDGIRPDSIKVQLYANDKKAGDEVTLTAADNWTYTW
ncbi:Cna B-type domain-containing protein, partial [Streptococcus zalophi]|uniref:Cna B-type domain-containing protein n=1 Tax=Streptococcus zalophi TaxID=640031 RepID=UPI00285264CC